MRKLLGLLAFAAAAILPVAAFAANPSPPAASYGNMHVRCGYSDGGVLTTSQLDCGWNDSLQQDGSGNTQEIVSVRLGTKGFITDAFGEWVTHNAYTIDAGNNWYPFDESAPSFGIKTGGGGAITFNYSPALNADGPITWTVLDTWGSTGSAAIAAEASTRASAITAEAAARASADTTLTNNLNTEITNRTNGDTALTVTPSNYGNVDSATTAALPAYTYANGTAGVGATLTENANGALPAQDGVTLTAGQKLLVKNESGANRKYHGIYTVTQVGNGSNPYILTRASDADAAGELSGLIARVQNAATVQGGFDYFMPLAPGVITLGNTPLPFVRSN
jgi:hypothetical protein